jgi:hypothetical protein
MQSELFYGKNELPMTSQEIKTAKTICSQCDVRRDCLITSLKDKEEFGVWGGYTSFERRAALARNNGKVKGAMNDYDDKAFVLPRKRKK